MKFLLVLAVLAIAWWIWRSQRDDASQAARRAAPPPARPPSLPAEMVACAHCGVHLPLPEAIDGGTGLYFCSEAHRRAHRA